MQLQRRQRTAPLHTQIADILRQEILTQCQPGEKLDSERKLAAQLGISTLTLSKVLNGLVHEGLIERRRGSGTYVSDWSGRQHVAIIRIADEHASESSFRVRIFNLLAAIFHRRGYRHRFYTWLLVDGVWVCPDFTEEVAHGKVCGAAFVAVSPDIAESDLRSRKIPYVGSSDVPIDRVRMVADGAQYLLQRGCRKIALLGAFEQSYSLPAAGRVQAAFQSVLREQGVAVEEKWVRLAVPAVTPGAGWEQFREVWSARVDKPDGLLVTDDVLFRDVALGILDSHIQVPQQLQVVAHANKGSGMTYPFPVAQLLIDPQEYAENMADVLIQSMTKQPVTGPIRAIAARLIVPDESHAPAAGAAPVGSASARHAGVSPSVASN